MVRRITRTALLLVVLGFNNIQQTIVVDAYSTGFNIPCLADGTVAQTGHGGGNGALSVGGSVFKVGDTAYTPTDVVQLPPDTKVTFSIENARTEGIFFRLSAKDGTQDVTAAFQPVDTANTMVMGTCVAPVAGVVHTNKIYKPVVQASFDTTGFTGEFSLQITNLLGYTEWYYSPFNLVISTVVDTPAPTAAPVAAPTAAPAAAPTAAPVAKPTKAPEAAPVAKPTKAPEAVPVAKPTKAPEAVPVAKPTKAPEAAPVAKPTKAPVAEPEPTKSPVAPVSKPTKAPVTAVEPTITPVAEPTEAPVAEPTETPVAEPPVAEPTESPISDVYPTLVPTPEPNSVVGIASFVIAYEAPGASEPNEQENNDVYEFTLNYLNQSFAEYYNTVSKTKVTTLAASVSNDAYPDADIVTEAAAAPVLQFVFAYGVIESYEFVSEATFNILSQWRYFEIFFEPIADEYLPSPEDVFTTLQDFINDATYTEAVATNFRGTPFENVISTVATLITTDSPSVSVTDAPVPRSPRARPTASPRRRRRNNNSN